jgi:hypothetical protein
MLTITEGLAEIKTIGKRIEKRREFVTQYIARQEGLKDPLSNEGGSQTVIKRERQAIADLEERIVTIRRAIQEANATETITIGGETRPIADWLVWRREVSGGQVAFVSRLRNSVIQIRRDAQQKGMGVVTTSADAKNLSDIIVNVDEAALAAEAEKQETILGNLDGQLSLKNATTTIDI